jgi:hypothetical protein
MNTTYEFATLQAYQIMIVAASIALLVVRQNTRELACRIVITAMWFVISVGRPLRMCHRWLLSSRFRKDRNAAFRQRHQHQTRPIFMESLIPSAGSVE